MYEKCLNCSKIGVSCDGPNFMAMTTADLIEWCNARRKQLPGLTYDRIVELTGLSKGTVSGFFGGTHADYRIETIRPILKLLVGGEWDDNPCADPTVSEKAAYEAEIEKLKTSIVWHEDKIKDLKEKNASLELLVKNNNTRATADKAFLQEQIKSKNTAILILSISLAVVLLVIIAALIVDRLDPSIGFFWLEGLFHPQSVKDGVDLIGKGI